MNIKSIQKIIEIASVLALFLLFVLPLVFMDQLPEKIPSHFNAKGIPDAFGGKSSIWLLPSVGLGIYIMFTLINLLLKNSPPKPKNGQSSEMAKAQNVIALEMLLALKGSILIAFAYLVWATIQVALENWEGLGTAFLMLFMFGIFGITGYYIFKMMTVKVDK